VRPPSVSHQTNAPFDSITKALSGVLKDISSTSDLLRIGVGLGMSLGAQGLLACDDQSRINDDCSSDQSDDRCDAFHSI